MREIIFENSGFEYLTYWAKTNLKILKRIIDLIDDAEKKPFSGIGKPEPLKFNFSGYWSRRINDEHRLVYKVTDKFIIVAACKNHY